MSIFQRRPSLDPADERVVVGILDRDAEDPPIEVSAFIPEARPTVPAPAWAASQVITEIYLTEYKSLVRLAMLLVHDVPTAEEVVQDSFEALRRAWPRLHDSQKALSYLRQAVVNRSRSVLRYRAAVDRNTPDLAPDEPSAETRAIERIERDEVAAALRMLPARQREALVLRYYGDFSEAEIAAAMGISRGAVKSHTARGMSALKSILGREAEMRQSAPAPEHPGTVPIADRLTQQLMVADPPAQPVTIAVPVPVSIYLSDEAKHAQVEAAVEEWLATAGIAIEEREQPVIGSWFRSIRAAANVALSSEIAHDVALTALHAADARAVLAQDANITATLLANLAPVIGSLQPTKDAAIRAGSLLIVKVDWVVQVIQLTAAQQAILDHQSQLSSDPRQIIAAIGAMAAAPPRGVADSVQVMLPDSSA